jgi:hypothetical protein
MRPNQQNKNRSRGRSNNNGGRKHGNPLSRNYESNGPDVKVRGNAAHVAEKYIQLARDAQSSGDSVMAENYLQHAEHYFRILFAAQQQMSGQRDPFASQDEDDFDDEPINDRFSMPERPQFNQQNQAQQAQPMQQGGEGGDSVADAPVEAAEAGEGQPQGDDGPRHRRDRRPRRRRPAGEGDPANAPQPDVGELPAFLTAGPPAAE